MFFVSFFLAFAIVIATRVQSQSEDSCLNLTVTRNGENNICRIDNTCMQCTIRNTDIPRREHCTRNLNCAIYTYPSDTIFEDFFRRYASSINRWFPDATSNSDAEYFAINIDTFSHTEITSNYLEGLLTLNMPRMNLHVKLKNSPDQLNAKTIENKFSLGVAWINIVLPCKNASQNGTLNYIRLGNGKTAQSILRDDCVSIPVSQVRF